MNAVPHNIHFYNTETNKKQKTGNTIAMVISLVIMTIIILWAFIFS